MSSKPSSDSGGGGSPAPDGLSVFTGQALGAPVSESDPLPCESSEARDGSRAASASADTAAAIVSSPRFDPAPAASPEASTLAGFHHISMSLSVLHLIGASWEKLLESRSVDGKASTGRCTDRKTSWRLINQ